jgi:hypothetical protein
MMLKSDSIVIHAEQLHGFICAQAAESVGCSVFHAMALETAAQAHAFERQHYDRSCDLFFNAAMYEKHIAQKVTGVPHTLLMLNVINWLIEGSSMDDAYVIILEVLKSDTLLPYVRQRFEYARANCEAAGCAKRPDPLKTDLEPQPLVEQES